MKKLLIIKTGESETLNEELSSYCSLGDVLRHFSFISHIKELFPDQEIFWLTDESAVDLFCLIEHELNVITSVKDISLKEFDILNFEKDWKYLELVTASSGHSFGFCSSNGRLTLKNLSGDVKAFNLDTWYEVPFEEEIFNQFGLRSSPVTISKLIEEVAIVNDLGLNWKSGMKWPEKTLPKSFWDCIYEEFSQSIDVSWQRGFNNLIEYINWIASCKKIVTLDSLGLHIANLIGRDIVALFGPTSEKQVFLKSGTKLKFLNDDPLEEMLQKTVICISNNKNEKS